MPTSPEEWARVRELFESALALPPERRSAHIAEVCGNDRILCEQVELLLASHERADGFLGTRAALTTIDGVRISLEGSRLGPYQLGPRLGAGGMGEVYKAKDTRLDRTVAIKVLPAHVATAPQARERFEREARAVAALNHPHICTLYDVGSHDGVDFLVMEYLDGVTLTCPVPVDDAVKLGIDIAGALAAAHRQGILHRDLKPGNVMVTPNGVKLLDFGLAKSTQSDISVTQSGIVVGTVAYMSPEQVNGQPLDARSDIFSFGALLYEMVSGKAAFDGATAGQVMSAVLRHDPPPLEESALEPIARKCLAKDSSDRYRTIDEVKAALEQVALGRTGQSAPVFAKRNRKSLLAHFGRAHVPRIAMLLAGAVAVALGLTWWAVTHRTEVAPSELSFRQITSLGNVVEAALSPDGRSLAFVTDTQGDRRLMMRDLAGGPTIELAHGAGLTFPVWTRDGAEIHFATTNGGSLVSRLGGESRKSFGYRPFTWAPDGSQIATASISAPVFLIATSDGRRLTDFLRVDHARFLHGIDWHLKSNRLLLFGFDEQDQSSVWIATPDGKSVRRVFSGPEYIESAFWNPTADVIYAFRVRNLSSDLIALTVADGGSVTARVLAAGLPLSTMSGISADSSALLQVRGVISTNLWALDLSGPQPLNRRVTSGTGFFSDPDISPDGRWIAAVFKLGSKTAVVKVPLTGGEPVPLISGVKHVREPVLVPRRHANRIRLEPRGRSGHLGDGCRRRPVAEAGDTCALDPPYGAVDAGGPARMAAVHRPVEPHELSRARSEDWRRALPRDADGQRLDVLSVSRPRETVRFFVGTAVATPQASGPWRGPTVSRISSRRTCENQSGWSHDGHAVYAIDLLEMLPAISRIDVASGNSTDLHQAAGRRDCGRYRSRDGRTLVVTVQEQTGDAWLLEHLNTRPKP